MAAGFWGPSATAHTGPGHYVQFTPPEKSKCSAFCCASGYLMPVLLLVWVVPASTNNRIQLKEKVTI